MRQGLTTSEAGKLGAEAAAKTHAKNKLVKVESYNQNSIRCKYCNLPIPYEKRHSNKFCNHSCAASFNSPNIIHNSENPYHTNCANCNISVIGIKFCSRDCQKGYNWKLISEKIIYDGYDTSHDHRNARRLLIEKNNGTCQICGLAEWQGQPMPLVMDHMNGNSEDGSLSNLRIICNNCDALTATYKNKGNGRAVRRQRYKDGKSY